MVTRVGLDGGVVGVCVSISLSLSLSLSLILMLSRGGSEPGEEGERQDVCLAVSLAE